MRITKLIIAYKDVSLKTIVEPSYKLVALYSHFDLKFGVTLPGMDIICLHEKCAYGLISFSTPESVMMCYDIKCQYIGSFLISFTYTNFFVLIVMPLQSDQSRKCIKRMKESARKVLLPLL